MRAPARILFFGLDHKRHGNSETIGPQVFTASPCPAGRGSRRLLLGHAVHGPESPDEISGIDGGDFSGREQLGQSFEGDTVVGAVEYRNQNHSIRNVEVRITCRKSPPFENNGLGHRKFNHCELPTILVASGLQAPEIRPKRSVI